MRAHCAVRTCAALAAAAVVAGLGVSLAAPTAAVVDTSCPVATDLTTLPAGAPLHGITVSTGTAPEPFTGSVIGIQKDGIVPGVDLVVVTLDSPAIRDAGGVWQGMSGSPVYAADDSLVGAVSWALSYGASEVVGVTPAAEMQAMLDDRTPVLRSAPSQLRLSRPVRDAAVASGAASRAEVRAGMQPMTLPLAVSGLSPYRIDQLAGRTDLTGFRPYSTGSVPATAPADTEIVPGGNLAASIAYGSFSAVAVGTTTAVCGDEVLAFGHPLMDVPQGMLTMHGADALYIQPDSLGQPYKLANATGPVGSLPDNLLPGLHGHLGDAPTATEVDSTSTVADEPPISGTTYISLRPFVPTYLAYAAVSVEDHALGVNMNSWFGAPGTDLVTWTVLGERADGTPFTWSRTDRFASATDIAYTWPWELHDQLNQLMNNETETVTVSKVTTTSTTDPVYKHLRIAGFEMKVAGAWQPLSDRRTVELVAGKTYRFRVVMHSAALGTRHQLLRVEVPLKAAGRYGELSVSGGDDEYTDASGATVDRMLAVFTAAPRNDQVLTRLSFAGMRPITDRYTRLATVGSGAGVQLHVME